MTGLRHAACWLALVVAPLCACDNRTGPGGDGESVSCTHVAAPGLGSVSPVSADGNNALCIRLPAGTDRYVLAFTDTRYVERSRTGPELLSFDPQQLFHIYLRGVKPEIVPRVDILHSANGLRIRSDIFVNCSDKSSEIFCRDVPWQIGDTVNMPDGTPRVVLGVEPRSCSRRRRNSTV